MQCLVSRIIDTRESISGINIYVGLCLSTITVMIESLVIE